MQSNQKTPVYLSLGSNLGDREGNLEAIRAALPPEVEVRQASSIYITEPWGYTDQPDFLNQVLLAETKLKPQDLLVHIKDIEKAIGREPGVRYGPRLADIDIILFGNVLLEEEGLIIPHPRFKERAFVLVPLAEISPDLRVPGTDQTVNELLQGVDTSGVALYQD
jgi:2-amino-4-hydroxy-6-hydroxymethyldihydropteridine diphosphokinase